MLPGVNPDAFFQDIEKDKEKDSLQVCIEIGEKLKISPVHRDDVSIDELASYFGAPLLLQLKNGNWLIFLGVRKQVRDGNEYESFAIFDPLSNSRGHMIFLQRQQLEKAWGNSVVFLKIELTGCSVDGSVATLGRSGSDYSGAIIGAGIDAEQIIIWTDVDGVMTTDPRMIPEARVIDSISFIEMMEMSYFGAKVIHSRALIPAMEKNIPVYVKNTFNPTHPGTVVTRESHEDKRIVKSVSLIKNSCLVTISGFAAGKPGVAGDIFTALAQANVNVMLISQGSSEMNISLVILDEQILAAEQALKKVKTQNLIKKYSFNKMVHVVSVVGSGMKGTPGTLSRIFDGLGKAGINVMMLSQGSEVNVSFVVSDEDGPKAVRAIHDQFHLAEADEEK